MDEMIIISSKKLENKKNAKTKDLYYHPKKYMNQMIENIMNCMRNNTVQGKPT